MAIDIVEVLKMKRPELDSIKHNIPRQYGEKITSDEELEAAFWTLSGAMAAFPRGRAELIIVGNEKERNAFKSQYRLN